jgi:hypothetical protein
LTSQFPRILINLNALRVEEIKFFKSAWTEMIVSFTALIIFIEKLSKPFDICRI